MILWERLNRVTQDRILMLYIAEKYLLIIHNKC